MWSNILNMLEKKENQAIEKTTDNSVKNNKFNAKVNTKKSFVNYDNDKEFKDKVVKVKRISKTVKGGRRIYFNALVVVGNIKGNYGFSLKKRNEVSTDIKKALKFA